MSADHLQAARGKVATDKDPLRELERICRGKGISTAVDVDSRDFWLFMCVFGHLAAMDHFGQREMLAEMLKNGPFRPAPKLYRKAPAWKLSQRMLEDFPDERVRDFFNDFVMRCTPGLPEILSRPDLSYEDFCSALREKAEYHDFYLYIVARAFRERTDDLPELAAEFSSHVEDIRRRYRAACLGYRLRKAGFSPDQERIAKLAAPYQEEIVRLQAKLARAGEKVGETSTLADMSLAEKEEAEREIGRLKAEIASLHESYGRQIAALEAEAARLRRQNAALLTSKKSLPLAGMKICVVGDPNRAHIYRGLIEFRGAEMDFLDGFEDKTRAAEAAIAADGLIVVTAYCCHVVSEAAESGAARVGIPVVWVNTAGSVSFARGVEEMERRFSEALSAGGAGRGG